MNGNPLLEPTGLMAGKTVLVTGAGANIGRAIALEVARQGARVFFADKNAARCSSVEKELLALGATAQGFVADLSHKSEIEKLHVQLESAGVVVDTLINNVGVKRTEASAGSCWWENWQRVYDTNVAGPTYLTKLTTEAMIANGMSGSVVFITSIHQWHNNGDIAYSSSKAALGMIVRELAVDLAPHMIRVNGIAPGYVGEDENGAPISHPPTLLGGTSILPHSIGRAAVYLCADYFSNRVTGSILTLDGGLSLHNHLTGSTPGASAAAPSPLHSLARKLRRAIQPSIL